MACTSAEEILAPGRENGIEISQDEAKIALSYNQRLSVDNLEKVSSGSDCGKGCSDTCC